MLLQTTKRNEEGTIVARVSLCRDWSEYMVTVYEHGRLVSAHYTNSSWDAVEIASDACLQSVTQKPVSSRAMTEPMGLVPL